MPIYEYECSDCGTIVEAIQKTNDSPLTECPECDGGKLRKLLSAPAFQFKGSGWYVTDYAGRGASAKEKEKEKEREKGKGAGEEKASEKGSSEAKGGDGSSTKSEAASTTD